MTSKLVNLFVLLVVLSYFAIDVESCHSTQASATEDKSRDNLSKDDLELYRSIKKFQQQKQRSKRSVHRYFLELLIVVDQSMVDYHGEDLVPYLTSTMAAVQHHFKYALVDDSIQIQVIDVLKLKNSSVIDYTNGTAILDSFCIWKQRAVAQHAVQHDAALFLTRYPIPDRILGYAYRGSICGDDSCLIVRDTGMGSVNTIAHEMGHVLGAQHDETPYCQLFFGYSTTKNMMSAIIRAANKWYKWSECSSLTMTFALRKLRNQCLTHNFKGDYLKVNADHRFLGQHYSLDKQCELRNRSTPSACPFRLCEHLRCKQVDDSESYCLRENVLWADGTECGSGKWCENGQCVQADQEVIQRLKDTKWTYSEAEDHKTKSKISVNTRINIYLICLIVVLSIGIFVVFIKMKRTRSTPQISNTFATRYIQCQQARPQPNLHNPTTMTPSYIRRQLRAPPRATPQGRPPLYPYSHI